MSDGPHRTLPMRRGWKRLAKRADKSAFNAEDVKDAVGPALTADWAIEVPRDFFEGVRDFCGGRPGLPLQTDREVDLEALKRAAAGRGSLAGVLVDFAAQALAAGRIGEDALREAVRNTLHDRALRDARQVEEHYLREASARRAAYVRARIEAGIATVEFGDLAGTLMTQRASLNAAPPQHEGVDDGVDMR
jgi:hypothetical protein